MDEMYNVTAEEVREEEAEKIANGEEEVESETAESEEDTEEELDDSEDDEYIEEESEEDEDEIVEEEEEEIVEEEDVEDHEEEPEAEGADSAQEDEQEEDQESESEQPDYKAQFEEQKRKIESLVSALNKTGFKGNADDISDTLHANELNISVDEYRRRRETDERVYTNDLLSIKERYPDEKAIHVSEFGEGFAKLRSAGLDAVKAYEVLNMDKVIEKKVSAAVNADRKKRSSKKHLNANGVTGTRVPNDVPASVYAEYRKFFPNMSDKEIRTHYNGTLKD